MGIILAILLFSAIVIFHELGHFLLAKKNKIRVDEFSLGLGPTIFGKQFGETKFSLKLLPFGGACMMGEDDVDDMSEGSFNSKSVWARMSVIVAGPVFNLILAWILCMIIIGWTGYRAPIVSNVTSDAGAVASVSRVYKGEPSGTVFSPALKISFDAPKDLVSSTQPMALLYATTGIDNKEIMKIDPTADPVYINGTGAEMSVAHFSKFAAGFELALAETEDISTDTTIVEKVVDYCSDGKAGNIPVVVTTTNAYVGENLQDLVGKSNVDGQVAKNAVYNRISNRLQADGYQIGTQTSLTTSVPTEADRTVASMSLKKTYTTNTYVFKFMTKGKKVEEIQVVAKKLIKIEGTPVYKQSHGHGHGDGNNAGGGIIIPD